MRLNRASAGFSSGTITHTSPGAASLAVTVSGTAAEPRGGWTAYNDVAWASGQPDTNITTYTLPGSGTLTGRLVDYQTGAETPAAVTITASGSPIIQTQSDYGGAESSSGTDAYNTFHGIASAAGVVGYGNDGWYIDLAFSGLDPGKTYTFATSVNRAGGSGGDPAYTSRFTRYTIMDMASAANASTAGVGVLNEHSVYFCTGENTANGYVARWTHIRPNAQGSFTVRAQPHDLAVPRVYAFGAFMLREEDGTPQNLTVTVNPGQSKVYGAADPVFAYTASDPSVTLTGALGRTAGENVGTYAVTLGSLSAGPDYTITLVPANFTITPRPASVQPDDASKFAGEDDPVLTGTLTGFLVKDGVTAVYTRASGETVEGSPYTISAVLSPAGVLSNYDITYHAAQFTINANEPENKILLPVIHR